MGAMQFFQKGYGKTANKAFSDAISDAQFEHGQGGYSGSILEKSEYVMLTVPEGVDPWDYAETASEEDPRVQDKWGPAGCIDLSEGEYLFFGWASS